MNKKTQAKIIMEKDISDKDKKEELKELFYKCGEYVDKEQQEKGEMFQAEKYYKMIKEILDNIVLINERLKK